ncbi:MAG: hypothetical protein ABID63_15260 [Pseudomonadota bacterium]
MSRRKELILGAVIVTGLVGAGLHFAAPAYMLSQLRATLTDPASQVRGEFSDFRMSLFGGTLSANNIKLAHQDGSYYEADRVEIDGVDWLAFYGITPGSSGIAAKMRLDDPRITRNGLKIIMKQATLENIQVNTATWMPQGYGAGKADIIDVTLQNGVHQNRFARLDGTDIGYDTIGSLNVTDWNFSQTAPVPVSGNLAQGAFAECAGPVQLIGQLLDSTIDATDAALCREIAFSDLSMRLDDTTTVNIAAFDGKDLTVRSIGMARLDGLAIADRGNHGGLSAGQIEISDFNHDITPDMWRDLQTNPDPDQLIAAIKAIRFASLSLQDPKITVPEGEIGLGRFALNGLDAGILGQLDAAGFRFTTFEESPAVSLNVGALDVRRIHFPELIALWDNHFPTRRLTDTDAQMARMQEMTMGELGFPLGRPLFESYRLEKLDIDISDDETFGVMIDLLDGKFGNIETPPNAGFAYARSLDGTLSGLKIRFPDKIANDPVLLQTLDIDDLNNLTLDMAMHQVWNPEDGTYVYAIDNLELREIGAAKLELVLAGLPADTMHALLDTQVADIGNLGIIVMTQLEFARANLELSGEKLLPFMLGLASLQNGMAPDEMQLMAGMTVLQTQQAFAQSPVLADALGQLAEWLATPQHLQIGLAPQQPVLIGALAGGQLPPPALAELLGLGITANP